MTPMTADDPVGAIARAVLYEGYLLWPYRRSALKNQKRWNFGSVLPRSWSESGHADDRPTMRAELVVELDGDTMRPTVDVEVRFLHLVERRVALPEEHGLRYVDALVVQGERHEAWEEATERTIPLDGVRVDAPDEVARAVSIAAGTSAEWLHDATGEKKGALVRHWGPLTAAVSARSEQAAPGLVRLAVTVTNETGCDADSREVALRYGLLSTHIALRAHEGARFASMTDPSPTHRPAVERCVNEGCWPVLVGDPHARDRMLASPIILPDFPAVAPESPGDLFDGGEIDELLALNILGLTEDEHAEIRATDPRAREILERTRSLTRDQLMALHGTFRDVGE